MDDGAERAFREILEILKRLPASGPQAAVDPTANVLEHVRGSVNRIDDIAKLREIFATEKQRMNERHDDQMGRLREKLAESEKESAKNASKAESRRVDALLSAASAAVALASKENAVLTATLATQTASLRGDMDNRMRVVESQQYASGGRDVQRVEERGQSNVDRGRSTGIIVAIASSVFAALLALGMFFLKGG